jgi:hypothetical protein
MGDFHTEAVPNSVPTPYIDRLFSLASGAFAEWYKSLETSSGWQSSVMVVPSANLLILREFLVPDQEVGSSNPLAPAIHRTTSQRAPRPRPTK